jgi:hypothetical protein
MERGEYADQVDSTPIQFPKLSPSSKPTSSRIWFARFYSQAKQLEASRKLQLAIDNDDDLAFRCLKEVADLEHHEGTSKKLRVSSPAEFDPRSLLQSIFPDSKFNPEGQN